MVDFLFFFFFIVFSDDTGLRAKTVFTKVGFSDFEILNFDYFKYGLQDNQTNENQKPTAEWPRTADLPKYGFRSTSDAEEKK